MSTKSKSKKKSFVDGASPLEWNEMKKLSKYLVKDNKHALALYIVVAATSGFRASDLLRMKWSDLLGSDQFFQTREKKTDKDRLVKIPIEVLDFAQRVHDSLDNPDENDFIFRGRRSKGAWSINYVNRILKQAKSDYPIKHRGQFSTHSLRKTFGKRMYDNSNDKYHTLLNISKIFNHSSLAITRLYIGIQAEEIEQMYDSIW